jgi:hypothetical protein
MDNRLEKLRKLPPIPLVEFRGSEKGQSRSPKAAPALQPTLEAQTSQPAIESQDSQPAKLRAALRTEVSATYLIVEHKPISAYDDNPVTDERGAAIIVGVSAEQLKKWRQRGRGPDYIQYGPGGTVRYELRALMDFRAAYRVRLSPDK